MPIRPGSRSRRGGKSLSPFPEQEATPTTLTETVADKRLTGIYIARGDDTLGPYDLREARVLLRCGYLRPDDFAARNGDAAWVALISFLPTELSSGGNAPGQAESRPRQRDIDLGAVQDPEPIAVGTGDVSPTTATEPVPVSVVTGHAAHPHRWRRLSASFAIIFALALALIGANRWMESRHQEGAQATALLEPGTTAATPLPAAPAPVVLQGDVVVPSFDAPADLAPRDASPTSPAPNRDTATTTAAEPSPVAPPVAAVLRGSVSLPDNNLGPISVGGLRVGVYKFTEVEAALAPARSGALAVRDRLDPQIEQARADLARRSGDERSALQAWRASSPDDSVRSSLRFAYTSATGLTRTAENDLRYLVEERASTSGGAMFFQALPAPVASVETDAQGAFALTPPTAEGELVLAVTTRQPKDGGGAAPRFWLVKLTERQRTGLDPVLLAVGNSTGSADAASLVCTAD